MMAKRMTREEIVTAADDLFYRQGFDATSFADIAAAVNISRGNFYYHFQSKDEILAAVMQRRSDATREMLDRWESIGETPADRIRCFIRILIENQSKIRQFGCPVGTMFTELAKLDHTAKADARRLFSLFRDWLAVQFTKLGHAGQADTLAMQVLARSQGVATLASAFPDEEFLTREVRAMEAWLDDYIDTTSPSPHRPIHTTNPG